eukprot:TRINITY_DN23459_c0_g1_i2.p1 TRINITY_DN23459_c0_g1~~TRINITY_DN23459_c0_g1_i2.p1  ORF type:complete len:357 (-),score=49.46 TRINITY_DN23459_c0_g1_i2:36-1106(-)
MNDIHSQYDPAIQLRSNYFKDLNINYELYLNKLKSISPVQVSSPTECVQEKSSSHSPNQKEQIQNQPQQQRQQQYQEQKQQQREQKDPASNSSKKYNLSEHCFTNSNKIYQLKGIMIKKSMNEFEKLLDTSFNSNLPPEQQWGEVKHNSQYPKFINKSFEDTSPSQTKIQQCCCQCTQEFQISNKNNTGARLVSLPEQAQKGKQILDRSLDNCNRMYDPENYHNRYNNNQNSPNLKNNLNEYNIHLDENARSFGSTSFTNSNNYIQLKHCYQKKKNEITAQNFAKELQSCNQLAVSSNKKKKYKKVRFLSDKQEDKDNDSFQNDKYAWNSYNQKMNYQDRQQLSLIHILRCRRYAE